MQFLSLTPFLCTDHMAPMAVPRPVPRACSSDLPARLGELNLPCLEAGLLQRTATLIIPPKGLNKQNHHLTLLARWEPAGRLPDNAAGNPLMEMGPTPASEHSLGDWDQPSLLWSSTDRAHGE